MKPSLYDTLDYSKFPERVAAMEAAGYDTLVTDETVHDAFVRAAVVSQHTRRVEIQTGIAVAFARSPLSLALAAHDVQAMSGGRFRMGLASQVRAHITRRYSMPWSHPARRMKEVIQAIHAIWDSWYEGQPLNFQGEFYAHTLMTPMFTPLDTQYGRPPIDLGAVGPLMTKVAAEVADGLISHSFTTERYLREVTLPAIEAGRAQRTHSRGKFEISGVPFVVTGETEEALAAAKLRVRKQIAFYASTPSYRGVLDLHGWGALHEELHPMSREGRWDEMGTRINDEVLNTIAVVGTGEEVVAQLRKRYTGIFDRVAVRFDAEGDKLAGLLAALKA